MNKPELIEAPLPKSQLVSRKTARGWSVSIKPAPDSLSMQLEELRKQIFGSIEEGEVFKTMVLITRFKKTFLERCSSENLAPSNIADHLRSEEGLDAIIVASANKKPEIVELLLRHKLGFGYRKADFLLFRLAFRDSGVDIEDLMNPTDLYDLFYSRKM